MIYGVFFKDDVISATKAQNALAELRSLEIDSNGATNRTNSYHANYHDRKFSANKEPSTNLNATLFYFDPNTVDQTGWAKLGVSSKNIKTILNYTGKGGRFRQPEDLYKIWGMQEDMVRRLLPYVHIASAEKPVSKPLPYEHNYVAEKRTITAVDINTADSAAWDALPGIGGRLSMRIISFREKLGGFYRIEQVAETFALPDSTFQLIRDRLLLNSKTLRKININTAPLEELKAHPYIRYALANAIVQYRKQHGNFTAVAGIKNIVLVTEDLFNKLAPYLVVD